MKQISSCCLSVQGGSSCGKSKMIYAAFVVDNFVYGRDDHFSDEDSFLEMGMIDSTGILELVGIWKKLTTSTLDDQDLVPANRLYLPASGIRTTKI